MGDIAKDKSPYFRAHLGVVRNGKHQKTYNFMNTIESYACYAGSRLSIAHGTIERRFSGGAKLVRTYSFQSNVPCSVRIQVTCFRPKREMNASHVRQKMK